MRYAFLIILLVVVLFLFYNPEPAAEHFTETKQLKEVMTATPEEIQSMVLLTQERLSEKLKRCTYCIEVSGVDTAKSGYTGNFIFAVLGGFPYGVSVIADIRKNEKGDFSVEDIKLQSTQPIEQPDIFVKGQEMEKLELPTKAELQALLNNV